MGGLGGRPLTENEGLSERPLTGKTGDFGAKNSKETYLKKKNKKKKRGSFRSAQVGKAVQRIVYFLKGGLLERPGQKRRGLGRKMGGGFRATHTHAVLIWEYPPPSPRGVYIQYYTIF